jgi:hypothetical protein
VSDGSLPGRIVCTESGRGCAGAVLPRASAVRRLWRCDCTHECGFTFHELSDPKVDDLEVERTEGAIDADIRDLLPCRMEFSFELSLAV